MPPYFILGGFMMRVVKNKDTGLIFPLSDILEEQINDGFFDNLEIITLEEGETIETKEKEIRKEMKKEMKKGKSV